MFLMLNVGCRCGNWSGDGLCGRWPLGICGHGVLNAGEGLCPFNPWLQGRLIFSFTSSFICLTIYAGPAIRCCSYLESLVLCESKVQRGQSSILLILLSLLLCRNSPFTAQRSPNIPHLLAHIRQRIKAHGGSFAVTGSHKLQGEHTHPSVSEHAFAICLALQHLDMAG